MHSVKIETFSLEYILCFLEIAGSCKIYFMNGRESLSEVSIDFYQCHDFMIS